MPDRYETLNTCADVLSLAADGIGESLTLDYKKEVKGGSKGRRDLAADVCAFANTQGGLLVIGVKDPEVEGAPPRKPDDFVGVQPEADLVHRIESRLLDSVSPRVYPQVKTTTDTFRDANGDERCFLLVRVPAGSQLHQVTVEKDFRFYRRAAYQNRPMTPEEVRERSEAIRAARTGTEQLFADELDRLSHVIVGDARVVFLASPTVPHAFAADPALPEVRSRLTELGKAHSGPVAGTIKVESPLTSSDHFIPAGDGARSIQRIQPEQAWTECRVRRDCLISHAQNLNALDPEEMILQRHSAADELWREVAEKEREAAQAHANMRSGHGLPSSVVSPTSALLLRPVVLRRKIRGFLRFVRAAYELGGWLGSVRFDVQITGGEDFVAIEDAPARDFFRVSERTVLRASTEIEHGSMEDHEDELTEETMRMIAWHFGIDEFS